MKPYVMIIDDEPGICTSLNLALKNDYNVVSFNSAQQALQVNRKSKLSCGFVGFENRKRKRAGCIKTN